MGSEGSELLGVRGSGTRSSSCFTSAGALTDPPDPPADPVTLTMARAPTATAKPTIPKAPGYKMTSRLNSSSTLDPQERTRYSPTVVPVSSSTRLWPPLVTAFLAAATDRPGGVTFTLVVPPAVPGCGMVSGVPSAAHNEYQDSVFSTELFNLLDQAERPQWEL
ncbi:MAG: hypothetical protein FRX49_12905 [Trebouxia sp. A1-2]|nr:MAG: hypothetical protein FRX49_12905 [Trebouxia sp. A1-2]